MSKYKSLTPQDRQELARRYRQGERVTDISVVLGVHPATVYRELERGRVEAQEGNPRSAYDPEKAQQVLQRNLRLRRGKR